MGTRWLIGLALGGAIFLIAVGAAIGFSVTRVDQSAANTLTLGSSVVLSSADLGLWNDKDRKEAVTFLQFEGALLKPPLVPIVRPEVVYVENKSTADLFLVKPCGDVVSTSGANIGHMDAEVHDLKGNRLGNTCDSPATVKLVAGDLVRSHVRIDLAAGLTSGDYSFQTVFEAVAPIDPPAGMVSWWPGDGNAQDIVDGNHGTLTGDFAEGMVGEGFSLDGTGDFVRVPPSANLNITGEVTVDLWAKRTVFAGGWAEMVFKGLPVTYRLGFAPNNQLRGDFERADGSDVDIAGPAVTDSEFHHYAYVRSGNSHSLFMDGVRVAIANFSGTPGGTSGLPLAIGSKLDEAEF